MKSPEMSLNKTSLQPVLRPVEQVRFFGGWVEGAKTNMTGSCARCTTGKFFDCFRGKTSLAKNFQKVFRVGGGRDHNPVTRPVFHR